MNNKTDLPSVESLLGAFAAAAPVTPAQEQQLAASNRALDQSPKFSADLQKANVVTALRQALDKRHENQSAFAKRWGKTRQYVSRIFNHDVHTNFTIDTVTEAAHLLGMRVTVKIHRPEQEVILRSRTAARNAYRSKPTPSLKSLSATSQSNGRITIDDGSLAA
jgi:AraC-like DNA-binding protein